MQKGFNKNINDFIFQNIDLGTDYEGTVGATLIKYKNQVPGATPILYIHGFSDYFYHPHLAKKFHEAGFNFYALELRKYGNSIRPHQHPNYCRSLFEYFPEIEFSLKNITENGKRKAILLGHSNGGLISAIYASLGEKRDLIELLILNSPFLSLNLHPIIRKMIIPVVGLLSKIFPYAKINKAVTPLYPKSIDENFHGEWEINHQWKPINGFPGYFSWLKAVSKAQKLIVQQSQIQVPVLVLFSSDSYIPKKWDERIMKSDIILNVADIREKASKLGQNVMLTEIDEAMHDVFLSAKKVREEAFMKMFEWIEKYN